MAPPSLIVLMVFVALKPHEPQFASRGQLCEIRDGRPGLSVPNRPYGLSERNATLNSKCLRAQELCESRAGRPGLPGPNSPYAASVDVKQH